MSISKTCVRNGLEQSLKIFNYSFCLKVEVGWIVFPFLRFDWPNFPPDSQDVRSDESTPSVSSSRAKVTRFKISSLPRFDADVNLFWYVYSLLKICCLHCFQCKQLVLFPWSWIYWRLSRNMIAIGSSTNDYCPFQTIPIRKCIYFNTYNHLLQ